MDPRRHPQPPTLPAAEPRTARSTLLAVALMATMLLTTRARAGELEVTQLIDASLALCNAADDVAPEERATVLARGLELADAAVAAADRAARAHYAVVCNLGKAIGLRGFSLGAFHAVARLQREIDATLALAPNHADALAAKGAVLVRLPRLLGGDPTEGEHWLRRALAVDPRNVTARTYLEELAGQPGFVAPASETASAAH
jgi:hypothetical protein